MAVSAKWFGQALLKALNKEIDFDTDTVKVMLCTSTYTPNQDTHDYKDDVTNEVTGVGYSAGGATLASKTIAYDTGTNIIKLDAADTSWTTATITARYAVIYVDTGVASTSPLLGYVDFGADESSSAGTFLIQWSADGIFKITVS